MGWRWAVAVYRGIYVLYIGRIFVLGPKVGGRRGWRSIGGRFNGVLLYSEIGPIRYVTKTKLAYF